jgi:hypothetical protein
MQLHRVLVLQLFALLVAPSESLLHRHVLHDQPDPEATLSTNYDVLRAVPSGLHQVDSADANVFASVLVTPPSGVDSSTHVAYDCTSASSIWNLQQDPSVKLEDFNIMDGELAAAVVLSVTSCSELLLSSVHRVVVGNAFFGSALDESPTYFYVVNSAVMNASESGDARSKRSTETCRLRLEMQRATLAQVYPDCRIKVHSTDISNLIRTESTEAVAAVEARRKLEASSFGFVEDSTCRYDCGEDRGDDEIDVDKCWAEDDGAWTAVQCTLQFYAQNSKCSSECGYAGDGETLLPSQCYDCSSSEGSCASGYNSTDDGCCRVLPCEAVDGTALTSPGTLAWNLEDDGLAVSNASYALVETGNCSDTSDPSTDCCRVTCENCFLNVSISSMFADVEIVGASFEEAIEMGLAGNANLEVALYAPNGCTLDETTQLKTKNFTIPLGETGLSIKLAMGLDLHRKVSLQPHGSIASIGASADVESLTAGSLRSDMFHDIQITSSISNKLAQSSIDLAMELELIPSFQATLSLLKGVAQVGVKAEFLVFVELNSTVQFPEPFEGLSSEYLDDSSLWHGGDCRLPHYMEYSCSAGYGEVNISIPLSVSIPVVGNTSRDLTIVSSSERSSYSLFSGCVATAYDAEILLATAVDAVSSLSDERKQALQTILVWVLGMTDIEPDFVNITSTSALTGEISITLSVPPSLGELFPSASDFEDEVYRRARNETFTSAVTSYVGVEIAAQCGDGWWGSGCEETCGQEHCSSGNSTCNAVDGSVLSCGACEDGYWGPICNSTCPVPDGCTSARCDQADGTDVECITCQDEDSSLCADSTSASSSVAGAASLVVMLLCSVLCFL